MPKGDTDALIDNLLQSIPQDSFEDRAYGCILGAFIGDSCGSYHEFSEEVIKDMNKCMKMPGGGPHKVGSGQITDDSELAMCSMWALIKGEGCLDL